MPLEKRPMKSEQVLPVIAIAMSAASLAWQVYDGLLKRSEDLLVQPARPEHSSKKALTQTTVSFRYYLTNTSEIPVHLLEAGPSTVFPDIGKLIGTKLEPGQSLVVKSKPYEISDGGYQKLLVDLSWILVSEDQPDPLLIRTSRRKYSFPLTIKEELRKMVKDQKDLPALIQGMRTQTESDKREAARMAEQVSKLTKEEIERAVNSGKKSQ
jgi:hypothetical protein